MAFYVYRPPACPACETRVPGASLIERAYTPAPGMHLVSYHCPRCQWMVEGRDPAQRQVLYSKSGNRMPGSVRLASSISNFSEVDEPMRRHSNPPLTHERLASRTQSDHLSPYPEHLKTNLPAPLAKLQQQGQGQDNIAFAKESNVLGLFVDKTDERE